MRDYTDPGLQAAVKRIHPARIRRTLGAAACVRERLSFIRSELRDAPSVGEYHLRGGDRVVTVRHPLLDMWVLEEIFRFRTYGPPPEVRRALAGLPRPVRILDVGGHVGLFGLFVKELLGDVEIVSFEPDPRNVELLRRCVSANRLERSWTVLEACAATADGTVEFQSSFHLSRAAASHDAVLAGIHERIVEAYRFLDGSAMFDVQTHEAACRDVFPFMHDKDLVKIDAEGAEWEILGDPRFGTVQATAVVLEYHPAYYPGTDADRAVRDALHSAGYRTGPMQGGGDARMLWGWRH